MMKWMAETPLVSVVTPVHNGESFLAECIESVLAQTYEALEYLIVDDCSTDATLDIALRYAEKDQRVRVVRNEASVGVMANHNRAFRLISPQAAYCKVVSAEDMIFADCIARMVELAENNPSVGVVGSYQLVGSYVRWQGLEYPQTVVPGPEICRRVFLGSQAGFGFGTPTSILYRADLVRATDDFYPDAAPHSDASACFKHLNTCDFGFVYQVLSWGRIRQELESAKSAKINRYASAYLSDLQRYGPLYLSESELKHRLRQNVDEYHRFLAMNVGRRRGRDFWDYHRGRLDALGYRMSGLRMIKMAAKTVLRQILNPGHAITKCWKRLSTS
jgi:glycosyltransferase involved in cell wall biosynthesis